MRPWVLRSLGGLLALLGAWAGIVFYVGPVFGYRALPGLGAWHWTLGSLEVNLAPGAVVLVGGALLIAHRHRGFAAFGGLLALLGGAWLVVGPTIASLWLSASAQTQVQSGTWLQAAGPLGYHYGTGTLVVALAAAALAGLAVGSARPSLDEPLDVEPSRPEVMEPAAPSRV